MQNKELFFIILSLWSLRMSLNGGNGNQGNSFWRPRGSSGDQQSAPSGSAQPNSFSASRNGWGRRQDSSNPQAVVGGRWGRPPAVCGPAERQSPQPRLPQRFTKTDRQRLMEALRQNGIRALPSYLQEKFMTYKVMHEMGFPVE